MCPDCQSKDSLIMLLADRLAMCSEILGHMAVKKPEFEGVLLRVKDMAECHQLFWEGQQQRLDGTHV